MGYPAYQCFKMSNRNVYCSKKKFKNHAEGSVWIDKCVKHHGLKANDIHGKPYTSNSQPNGATIYP